MTFSVIGINHKTAPVAIREQVYMTALQQELLLSRCRNNPAFSGVFVLSTCNRTEIYIHSLNSTEDLRWVARELFQVCRRQGSALRDEYFYRYTDEEAVDHLFQVITGLDSLVLGEKQILGQVKSAVTLARQAGTMDRYLNILSNVAIRAGKKVRHETGIDRGGSSVSWAAVMMAEQALQNLDGKDVLIIGAGKMSELAANQLIGKGVGRIFVINRTLAHARVLAEKFNGVPLPLTEMVDALKEVDVCICSSGAPHYVLECETARKIQDSRLGRPQVYLDISVPRNIDPAIAGLSNVQLYTIDDLEQVAANNIQKRRSAIPFVQDIIQEKKMAFFAKWDKQRAYTSSVPSAIVCDRA